MEQPITTQQKPLITHAKLDGTPIKCPCGNDFFTSIQLNVYRDLPTDLFNKPSAFNPTDNLTILECVSCGKRRLPVLSHSFLTPDDLKLAKHLQGIVDNWNKRYEAINSEE